MPPRLLAKLDRLDTLLSFLLNHPKQLLFLHPFQPGLLLLPLDRLVRFIIFDCDHVLDILQSILHRQLSSSGVSTTCYESRILTLRQVYQIVAMTLIVRFHLGLLSIG